jgi:hypothetical protein
VEGEYELGVNRELPALPDVPQSEALGLGYGERHERAAVGDAEGDCSQERKELPDLGS